jgi:DNA-binding Lrp family transcriptional regulator
MAATTNLTKSGGIRKGAGSKATPIDLKELEILYALHSTYREIADRFGVSVRTLHNRRREAEFGEVVRRGKARGCGNLRSARMKLVNAGNATMCIRLGKNLLGQTGAPSIRTAIQKIKVAADYSLAADKLMQAAARSKITPAQGKEIMGILAIHAGINVNVGSISRIEKIEQTMAAGSVSAITAVGSPGEERQDEPDRDGGKAEMSKENPHRRLQ